MYNTEVCQMDLIKISSLITASDAGGRSPLHRDELWTEPKLVEANEINSQQAIDCEGWVFKHLRNTNKQT